MCAAALAYVTCMRLAAHVNVSSPAGREPRVAGLDSSHPASRQSAARYLVRGGRCVLRGGIQAEHRVGDGSEAPEPSCHWARLKLAAGRAKDRLAVLKVHDTICPLSLRVQTWALVRKMTLPCSRPSERLQPKPNLWDRLCLMPAGT